MSNEKSALSSRLAALINLSKRIASGGTEASIASVSEALEWCYCGNLRLVDALHHTLEGFKEASAEPRLCMGVADIEGVILAPIKGFHSVDMWGPSNLQTQYSVEAFYTAMIKHVLGELMCTRVDWCVGELEAEAQAANAYRAKRDQHLVVDA